MGRGVAGGDEVTSQALDHEAMREGSGCQACGSFKQTWSGSPVPAVDYCTALVASTSAALPRSSRQQSHRCSPALATAYRQPQGAKRHAQWQAHSNWVFAVRPARKHSVPPVLSQLPKSPENPSRRRRLSCTQLCRAARAADRAWLAVVVCVGVGQRRHWHHTHAQRGC